MTSREKVLKFIIGYMTEFQYDPSVREIQAHMGWKSPRAVSWQLEKLELEGKIKYNGKRKLSVKGYKFGKDSRYDQQEI